MAAATAPNKKTQHAGLLDLSNQGLQDLLCFELQDSNADTCTASITSLDVSRNQLTSLQVGISGSLGVLLPQLRSLNLARNKLQHLQPLKGLTSLCCLDAHSNALHRAAELSTLINLTACNLAGNVLTELPCLTGLTRLTELNLRHNRIQQLQTGVLSVQQRQAAATGVPTGSAGAGGGGGGSNGGVMLEGAGAGEREVTAAATGAAGAGAAARVGGEQSGCLLPASLRRLSLAWNQLQDVSSLRVLRSLPALLDLCVDGNPFTAPCNNPHLAASTAAAVAVTAAAVGGSSGPGRRQQPQSCWCREAVLVAVCAPSLLMLDGRNVSPAERALLLTAGVPNLSSSQEHMSSTGGFRQQQQRQQCNWQPEVIAAAAVAVRPTGQGSSCSRQRPAASTAETTAAASPAPSPAPQQPPECTTAAEGGARGALSSIMMLQEEVSPDRRGSQSATGSSESSSSCEDSEALGSGRSRRESNQLLTQQQQPRDALQQQGSLRDAAVACGLYTTTPSLAAPSPPPLSPVLPLRPLNTTSRPAAAVSQPECGCAAGASGGADDGVMMPVVFSMCDAEVEEYLVVEKARLLNRRRGPPPPPPPPATTPGLQLDGCRCVLTGGGVGNGSNSSSGVLRLLKGEAIINGVSDLTLAYVAYAEVVAALPLLLGLRRLRSLTLLHSAGLATLPQLHPLLQLTPRLHHLSLVDCPISGLVLLRPYVAFRFPPSLQSLNGAPLTAEETAAAGRMFSGLEAALDAALDCAPQQAAVSAAGVSLIAASQPQPQQQANGRTSAAGTGHGGSSSGAASLRVTQLLTAMQGGAMLPPAAAVQQGTQFAAQLMAEAAAIQQQLWEFEEVTWPGLVQAAIAQSST